MKIEEVRERLTYVSPTSPWWICAASIALQNKEFTLIQRSPGDVYLARFWLAPPQLNSLGEDESANSGLLHWIIEPDIDPHLHDHPWSFDTFCLSGGYLQQEAGGIVSPLVCGESAHRGARFQHRITEAMADTWTLVTTGRRSRNWNFVVDGQLIDHEIYEKDYRGKLIPH